MVPRPVRPVRLVIHLRVWPCSTPPQGCVSSLAHRVCFSAGVGIRIGCDLGKGKRGLWAVGDGRMRGAYSGHAHTSIHFVYVAWLHFIKAPANAKNKLRSPSPFWLAVCIFRPSTPPFLPPCHPLCLRRSLLSSCNSLCNCRCTLRRSKKAFQLARARTSASASCCLLLL